MEPDESQRCVQVQNLLEAAGFSRSNPYNIVQQGKIAKMSQLEDHQRLGLLKEVGGALLYEDKRKESEKTMASQRAQASTIDESVCTPTTVSHKAHCRLRLPAVPDVLWRACMRHHECLYAPPCMPLAV
jgi:hypothetical protein